MPSNSDDLTPQKMLFMLVYFPAFFSIFVGIPYFAVRWILGSPPYEWFTALLVVASLFLFGPVCHRMRVLCPPWQRFHAWAYKTVGSMTLEELSTKRDEVYARIEKLRIERDEIDLRIAEINNLFEESHQLHVQGATFRGKTNEEVT